MALPDTNKLQAADSRTTGLTAVTIEDGSNYLGTEIDNSVNLNLFADIGVEYQYQVAPTASKQLNVCVLYEVDGTNYEDGAGSGVGTNNIDPFASTLVGSISPAADTDTAHFVSMKGIPLSPLPFKILVGNVDTAQTVTGTIVCQTYNMQTTDT